MNTYQHRGSHVVTLGVGVGEVYLKRTHVLAKLGMSNE